MLAEQRDADRRGHHRVDHRHRRERSRETRAPVGGLGQEQARRREPRDHQQRQSARAHRTGRPLHGHGLGEHRGHPERPARPRGQHDAAQDRPAQRTGEHDERADGTERHRGQQHLLGTVQGVRLGVPRERQQSTESRRRHQGAAPGRRPRPPPDEQGRHRQGEDDRQRAERLDQAERPVGERHHVQDRTGPVEQHGDPPHAVAHQGPPGVVTGRGHALLDDRPGRIRDRGDQ